MGGIAVARGRENEKLRMLVGSCIGLSLYDRRLQIGGMAHIVLPKCSSSGARSGETNDAVELAGKFADTAAPALMEKLAALASRQSLRLVGKIAGGANMFGVVTASTLIGEENWRATEKVLEELRIPIVGRHLGGERGRRLTFDLSTGSLGVEIAGEPRINI